MVSRQGKGSEGGRCVLGSPVGRSCLSIQQELTTLELTSSSSWVLEEASRPRAKAQSRTTVQLLVWAPIIQQNNPCSSVWAVGPSSVPLLHLGPIVLRSVISFACPLPFSIPVAYTQMSFQLCQPSAMGPSGRSSILFLILVQRELKHAQAPPSPCLLLVPLIGSFSLSHTPLLPQPNVGFLKHPPLAPWLPLGTVSPVATLPVTQQSPVACCPEHASSCFCLVGLQRS